MYTAIGLLILSGLVLFATRQKATKFTEPSVIIEQPSHPSEGEGEIEMKLFENVAALKAATLTAGQIVETKGYYAAGDLGAGRYLIEAAGASFDAYINHRLANNTVATLQVDAELSVEQCGAYGDNATDDTLAIQAALDTGKDVIFKSANYIITAPLTVVSQKVRGGVGLKGGSSTLSQSQLKPQGNYSCFVNGPGAIGFEIEGFLINFGDAIPTDSGTESGKVGFKFQDNAGLWPQFSSVKNCRVKGAWWGIYDNTGTYQSVYERIHVWNCRRGVYKQNGTTILFNTVHVQGGYTGFVMKDVISPTLLNCAVDSLTVDTTNSSPTGVNEDTGNFFTGCRSFSIVGFDFESNTMTGNYTSFMYFDASTGTIEGMTGYLNKLDCAVAENVFLFRVDNASHVAFTGTRPARNTSDLTFLGVSGGAPAAVYVDNASYCSLSGCWISAATGGSPAATYSVLSQNASITQRIGTGVSGTNLGMDNFHVPEQGSWTPTLVGVGGTAPTVTGRYVKNGDVVTVWITLEQNGGTYSSTAGSTYASDFPNAEFPTMRSVSCASDNTHTGYGEGHVSLTRAYFPTWAATTQTVTVTYTYYIG